MKTLTPESTWSPGVRAAARARRNTGWRGDIYRVLCTEQGQAGMSFAQIRHEVGEPYEGGLTAALSYLRKNGRLRKIDKLFYGIPQKEELKRYSHALATLEAMQSYARKLNVGRAEVCEGCDK